MGVLLLVVLGSILAISTGLFLTILGLALTTLSIRWSGATGTGLVLVGLAIMVGVPPYLMGGV